MRLTRVYLLILLLGTTAFLSVSEAAFSCVPFNRSELVSPCSVYDPSAFAYIDLSKTTLAEQLAYMASYISALDQIVSDPTAKGWAIAWGCQEPRLIQGGTIEGMRSCAVTAFGEVVSPPTYVPACLDMCKQYYAAAKPVLDAAGLGSLLQPSYCDSYTNDGLIINGEHIPCYNVTPSENATAPVGNCPSGFQVSKRGICSPQCPAPGYSSDQVFDIGLMQQIVGWISFVSASVLVVTFAILPDLRRWPNRIILFLMIATLPLSLAFMLATFVGGNVGDVWCGDTKFFKNTHIGGSTDTDPDVRSIASGGLCVFQSWLIVWSTLAIGMWWLILLFNTAVIIHNAKKMVQQARSIRLELLFHVLGWGIPTVLVIIPTAASKMDYEATNVFCFIASANDYGWRIGCWFVPMGIILVLGFANLIAIVILLLNNRQGHHGRMETILLTRLVISVTFLLIAIVLIFAYLIYSSAQLSNNLFWIYDYMICRVGGGSEASCTELLNKETTLVNCYRLGFAATFFLSVIGAFLVIFFASAKSFLTIVKGATGSGSSSRSRSTGDTNNSSNSGGSQTQRSYL